MPRDDVAARLRRALDGRDDLALAGLLDPRVRLVVDTGDASGGEHHGRAAVTRALLAGLASATDASLESVRTNGGPGLALRDRDGVVRAVLGIGVADEIVELWLCAAPDKLTAWNRRRPDAH